eukprot:TRINITY_DN14567_c0_g1_i2.p1 TRINITY_DN14567_c0_g1~~TRINITY_DN14567_c0_g1_i2.p1  ORF type:complete len:134 (-),score=42.76 TRINITY_DN14567_c0_g1_i2:43-444(-)
MHLQHQLKHHYPHLKSHGMNHPPSDQNQLIATVIGYLQMAGFGIMMFGKVACDLLKIQPPPMVQYMSDNKLNTFSMLFMVSFLSTQLHATGAFEVYYNGQLLHSKLLDGEIPSIAKIISALEAAGVQRIQSAY